MGLAGKIIIAHRGASRMAHENTLDAFRKAIAVGADAVELDVRKTRDNTLVVFHNSKIAGRSIGKLSFAELNAISKAQGFAVPTLDQVLELVAGKVFTQIELKEKYYETDVIKTALAFLKPENFAAISFNADSLQRIKKTHSKITTGLILGSGLKRLFQRIYFYLFTNKILSYANFVALDFRLYEKGFAKYIPANVPLTLWTVDSAGDVQKFLQDSRVSGIATNVPEKAMGLKFK